MDLPELTVTEHFDTPAATYRAHKPWAVHEGTLDFPIWVIECALCKIKWPCDASRMAELVLRPKGETNGSAST